MFKRAFATANGRIFTRPTPDPESEFAIGRSRTFLPGVHLSIRTKILLALAIVIVMMGMTNAVLMLQMLNYSRQYDAIINNITTANSISGNIKPAIDTEMWKIVAGKTEFTTANSTRLSTGSTANCSGWQITPPPTSPGSNWRSSAGR